LISPKTKNKKTPWVQRRESFLLVLKIYGGALRNLKSFTHCQSAAATPHGDLRRQQPIKIHHVHPLQQSVPSSCSSPSHHLPHPHSKLPTLCLQIHLCKSFLCVLLSCLGVIFGHLVYLFDSLYCVLSLSKREKMKKLKKKKKKGKE
jgi:hypothetical protein